MARRRSKPQDGTVTDEQFVDGIEGEEETDTEDETTTESAEEVVTTEDTPVADEVVVPTTVPEETPAAIDTEVTPTTTTTTEPVAEVTPEVTPVEAPVEAETTPVVEEAPVTPTPVVEAPSVEEEEAAPSSDLPEGIPDVIGGLFGSHGGPRLRNNGGVPGGRFKKVDTSNRKPHVKLEDLSRDEYLKLKHGYVVGTGSEGLESVLEFIERYDSSMGHRNNVTDALGASMQQQLYRNYLKAFSLRPTDRDIAIDAILWKFYKNETGSFKIAFLSRFTRNAKWDIGELMMYNSLNTVFHAIKDPTARVLQLREYKLGSIVERFPQDKIRYTEGFLAWSQSLT